jgi:intracellular septation protein
MFQGPRRAVKHRRTGRNGLRNATCAGTGRSRVRDPYGPFGFLDAFGPVHLRNPPRRALCCAGAALGDAAPTPHFRTPRRAPSTMKLLFDLFPVIVFFAGFRLARSYPQWSAAIAAALPGSLAVAPDAAVPDIIPIVVATLLAIVATLVQIGWLLARRHPIKPMLWVSCVLIVVFGGLTIWLHNEWFIKWKPSLLYLSFALILLGGRLFARRNLLGAVLGSELELTPRTWDRLLYAWSAFFLALAVVNLAVAYSVSTSAWVDFKTFGLFGLTLAFSIATAVYIARFVPAVEPGAAGARAPDARAIDPRGPRA